LLGRLNAELLLDPEICDEAGSFTVTLEELLLDPEICDEAGSFTVTLEGLGKHCVLPGVRHGELAS
jgi:hypothetical protein